MLTYLYMASNKAAPAKKEPTYEPRKTIGISLSTYKVLRQLSFEQNKPIAHIIRDWANDELP